ncbi:MAG TPA: glycoside hydrolase family 15 protein [Acidimicrobiia bacterium]|nr:glycoside hydrolase family 15 protein [Acidimicrobiia bacterium]
MPPLEDYALLGDRRTAALVSRAGSIDWWCVPRFDHPACFAALVGTPDHGRFLIAPAEAPSRSMRRYRPGTMVLETEHETTTGRVRVVDCLALGHARPLLVRAVEGVEGTVDMRIELTVRFDYGSIVPWVRRVNGRWRAVAGPDELELYTPVHVHGHGTTTVGQFSVGAGERVPFVLGWHPSHDPRAVPEDAEAAIQHTTETWSQWSERCMYSGEWRDLVLRSLLTLEALTFGPTGGIVAAPTTSLPESLGGTRNWDYRYCWVRDATLTLEALLIGGYQSEAMRWREWLLRAAAGDPARLQTMYGVGGERRLTELELDWLPGYEESRPVRTGNGAHSQLQLDVYGELLDVLWQAARAGTPPSENSWSLARLLLDVLETRWREPDEGIWEVRGPRRHFTHSKVMCWVAFDRAIAMVEQAGFEGPADKWRSICNEIHTEVCARAYDAEREAFTQAYDSPELDASVLLMPLVGFLPGDDPRVRSTIAAIRRDLTYGGFVRRYDPSQARVDGLGEPEGVFLPCSFWMVEALALAGEHAAAEELFARLLALANDVGLYAEEYDPDARRFLGNFPQAFTHLALVAAAHTLAPERSPQRRRRRDSRA